MGSPLRLTAVGRDADRAWSEVTDEFAEADIALSRFRDDAELVALDRSAGTGVARRVSRRLERAVVAAERARRVTRGGFDARVLLDLERLGEHGADIDVDASAAAVDDDRSWVDRPIARRLARGFLSLDRPIDLGGIGKGLALRWATARCERLRLHSFLIDAGGDIVVRGDAPEAGPWQIGIEDPAAAQGSPLAVIGLAEGAIATSSISHRRWVHQGRRVHHLIDPITGQPASGGLLAVTVVSRDPAWSEVWSKTLFLSGRRGIADEARRRGLAAWWVDDSGGLSMTAAARSRTCWVRAEAEQDQRIAASAASNSSGFGILSPERAFVTAAGSAATDRRAGSSSG
ncbi:MAG: FAD:protein FMN transferase [Chloroflexota bacterium]